MKFVEFIAVMQRLIDKSTFIFLKAPVQMLLANRKVVNYLKFELYPQVSVRPTTHNCHIDSVTGTRYHVQLHRQFC